jgi:hypothetical protein
MEIKLPEMSAFTVVKVRLYWVTALTLVLLGTAVTAVSVPVWQVYEREVASMP